MKFVGLFFHNFLFFLLGWALKNEAAYIGGIANHKQERWKQPLPDFIRTLYEERFGTLNINEI